MQTTLIRGSFALLAVLASAMTNASPANSCLNVLQEHPELRIDESSLRAITSAGLERQDFFRTIRIVAQYETGGCWAGATGNFDGQLLSVGIMQWNFGQGSLQPIIKRFSEKFSSPAQFEKVRDELMPKYGKRFFEPSCRAIPIGKSCSAFLANLRFGKQEQLQQDFKEEINALFNSQPMRQIQIDYFARNLTRVLSDLDRIYQSSKPKAWQVAWAMDIKTQQGNKFPTDNNIRRIKELTRSASHEERHRRLSGVIKWYDGLCDEGTSDGVRLDCAYNIKIWNGMVSDISNEAEREETVHFTHLVARTAQNQNGAYQANAFQRRATIVFGRGSVNGSKVDFFKLM